MRALLEEEARSLLNFGKVGRLGCVVNGEPYIVPINYLLEDGAIYIHSLPGRKLEALRAHPRACLQVDEIRDDFNWRSVIAYGNFEEIRVPSDRTSILGKLLARFPLVTPVESQMAKSTFCKLLTGFFFSVHSRIRTTVNPCWRNLADIRLSRRLFLSIFAHQYSRFVFGV